ncbi:anaerobic glycerol-3-phosphate dehydrogenase subunit C [Peptococcaceae bacterium CEB3]|nr:anaerobic glycerol-3-phosphate dehydrogenase subunit C [Peptococcaceae bacterium CEB3]
MPKTKTNLEERIAEASYVCGRCGSCRNVCPVYQEIKWESSSPRGKITLAKDVFLKHKHNKMTEFYTQRLLECTLCGKCEEICAAGIHTRGLWLDLRESLRETGRLHPNFRHLGEQIATTHNISATANEYRLDWTDDLDDFEVPQSKDGSEVAYFVGCVSSFYPQLADIPQSIVKILEQAPVKYTVLGGEEWCCGFPLISAGMSGEAQELARHNIEKVRALRVKTLITGCASCFHTWSQEYPLLLGKSKQDLGFEVLHVTEYFARLLQEKRLMPAGLSETVTYHDPCDLGRNSGVYEDPRVILQAIPGLDYVEMFHNRELADCCGGGGNLQMVDSGLSQAIAGRRVRAAVETGASILVSACQQCVQTLRDAARKEKLALEVMDVTELLWQVLDHETGGERNE